MVKSYSSLDEKPEAIIWEGEYDEGSKKVDLIEKNKLTWNTTIYTEAEIKQKIEALTQPGSTVFFLPSPGRTNMVVRSARELTLLSLTLITRVRRRRNTTSM